MIKGITELLRSQWKNYPLRTVLLLALCLRMFSAIFSQGYGMHDDHFTVIETPWSWTHNYDYDRWLPKSLPEDVAPTGHNFFYSGLNYLQFEAMQWLGIQDPHLKMFFIRLVLALFSLLTVFYSYRITLHLSNERSALQVALLNSVLWFMPFASVRNLVEVVAIPVLFAGVWLYLKYDRDVVFSRKKIFALFFSGFVTAISISIRFQVSLFLVGMALVMIFQRKWISLLLYSIGAFVSICITQGIPNMIVWGSPFIEMLGYIKYNLSHRNEYGNAANYPMYFEVLLAILIPPISFFLFFGFLRTWKKYAILFVPNMLFLLFHTYFPNRQERFILTIVPMVVMLGVIGWNEFFDKSGFWQRKAILYKRCWRFFWIINILLLIPLTLADSKKSRIEAMHFFFEKRAEVSSILIEDTGREQNMWMPVFYAGKPIKLVVMAENRPDDERKYENMHGYVLYSNSLMIYEQMEGLNRPEYIVFVEDIKLAARLEMIKQTFPDIEKVAHIRPSYIDRLMKKMNPVNQNEDFYIYRVN